MYLPIASSLILDRQESRTSVVIPINEKAKSSNIENIQIKNNERQNSQPHQQELFR